MPEDTEPMSAKQLAIHFKTDARTIRKFLRSEFGMVGQGQRWAIDPDEDSLGELRKQFNKYQARNRRPRVEIKLTPPQQAKSSEPEGWEDLDHVEDVDLDG